MSRVPGSGDAQRVQRDDEKLDEIVERFDAAPRRGEPAMIDDALIHQLPTLPPATPLPVPEEFQPFIQGGTPTVDEEVRPALPQRIGRFTGFRIWRHAHLYEP